MNLNRSLARSSTTSSPFSPRSRQSIGAHKRLSTSIKKPKSSLQNLNHQTTVLLKSAHNNAVERFGQAALPVLITEALTFADRNSVVSAKLSPNGYAWVVCGRRLLIWQYRQQLDSTGCGTPQRKSKTHQYNNQCYELQLPQSDLAHRADLVSVFISPGCNTPSCFAVSPEGVIWYWPAIAHENVSVEQLVDLQGQECDSLVSVEDLGCILATTTSTIVLIQPHSQYLGSSTSISGGGGGGSRGTNGFTCKMFKNPTGWLGGLGKRMSSLIFGPITTEQTTETKLVRILSNLVPGTNNQWILYVLAGYSLQKWDIICTNEQQLENMQCMVDLKRSILDAFQKHIWNVGPVMSSHPRSLSHTPSSSITTMLNNSNGAAGESNECQICFLDMVLDQNGDVVILSAGLNFTTSIINYALVTIDAGVSGSGSKCDIKSFQVLKMTQLLQQSDASHPINVAGIHNDDSLQFRMFICHNSNTYYIYNHKSIVIFNPAKRSNNIRNEDEQTAQLDVLELSALNVHLLGGTTSGNKGVFFCRNHGLLQTVLYQQDDADDFNITSNFNLRKSLTGAALSTTANLDNTSLSSSMIMYDSTVGHTTLNDYNNAMAGNLSIYNMDPEEVRSSHTDIIGQLRSSVIFYIKNQKAACQEILRELFPSALDDLEKSAKSIDSLMDQSVLKLCQYLLDDCPASDPRWQSEIDEESPVGIGSSHTMQVLQQLEDKQRASDLYLRFLKDTGIWNGLGACHSFNRVGCVSPTAYLIRDMFEKIEATIVLKSLPDNSCILGQTIDRTVKNYNYAIKANTTNGLTSQDIFYKDISRIQNGLKELVNFCEDMAHSDMQPMQIVTHVHDTNKLFLTVLNEVVQYRQRNKDNFETSSSAVNSATDFLTWISASGDEGLADEILMQHSLTYSYGLKLCNIIDQDGNYYQLRPALLDQLAALTDLFLDSQKEHLELIRNSSNCNKRYDVVYKQYMSTRQKLIKPLLNEKEWDRAGQLAEKYMDFETMVIICELTNNQQRLDEYSDRFAEDGFPQFVYNWYLKENKEGKLLERYRNACKTGFSSRGDYHLANFLSDHDTLSWMQHVFDKHYGKAARVLHQLGINEKESLKRQKTMLSLCKLAQLANDDEEDDDDDDNDEQNHNLSSNAILDATCSHLDLIQMQEEVPDYVLQQFGYDITNPCVIHPRELINLYICPEYSDATELEFKKALDILNYIDDKEEDDKNELWLKIWRTAILRDKWNYNNLDAPIEILQNTLFFKLIDLALILGSDPATILPPLDLLLQHESMDSLRNDKGFLFLIKTAYDHVSRLSYNLN